MRENILIVAIALLVFGGIGAFLLSIVVLAFTHLSGWPMVGVLGVVAYSLGSLIYLNWENFRG